MKANLFKKNDGMKILVVLPETSNNNDQNDINDAFKIVCVPFEGILQNEVKFVGAFTGNDLINLLEPDIVIEVGQKTDVTYEINNNLKYLSIKVPSITILNEVYSKVLLFNQFCAIKQTLNLQ